MKSIFILTACALALSSSLALAGTKKVPCYYMILKNTNQPPLLVCERQESDNNNSIPFCDRPGISWKEKKEHGCTKCGSGEHEVKS